MVQRNRARRRGAGAVEYGLVIALVAAGTLVAVSQTGGSIAGLLSGAAGKLNGINSTVQPAEAGPLYAFTSHTFTNCGHGGRHGPSLSDCRSAYSSVSWAQDSAFFDQGAHQGFQLWTVPETGTYRITAEGAEGGDADGGRDGGRGARIRGDFQLTRGQQLTIVVGQRGQTDFGDNGAGGGGSFVWEGARGSAPLIAAGGGGGGGDNDSDGGPGQAGENGSGSRCYSGGTNGYGATNHYDNNGAGAGWRSDGDGNGGNHTTFVGGSYNTAGGFGGGGAGEYGDHGGGGGGGYSGGAAGCQSGDGEGGGGGGSYNAGSNPSASSGANSGHGSVAIEFLGG